MERTLATRTLLKTSIGLAAGMFVLGLAGCGGQSGGEGGSGWEPTEDVTMIVPFEPGGGSDIFGRAMASGLEEVRPDVNINVENRAGGSGSVGYSYLLEQQADPHFLLASETTGVVLPLVTETPWTYEDFTPLAQLATDNTMLVVREDSPFESLEDVVEAAEQGEVSVGATGATGADSLTTGLIASEEDVEFDQVTFQSGGETNNALLGGDIDFAIGNVGELIGQLEAGEMRGLTVFKEERYSGEQLSEIPTAEEEGFDISFDQYRGPFMAGGVTEEERAYWEDAFEEWTESESYEEYIEDNYLAEEFTSGEEFENYLDEYEGTLEEALEGVE